MIIGNISLKNAKYRKNIAFNSTCNCGSCNCNCGSQRTNNENYLELDTKIKQIITK